MFRTLRELFEIPFALVVLLALVISLLLSELALQVFWVIRPLRFIPFIFYFRTVPSSTNARSKVREKINELQGYMDHANEGYSSSNSNDVYDLYQSLEYHKKLAKHFNLDM